jgi:hypothetical protein
MSPFSAYILPVGENAQSVQSISFDDEATGVELISNSELGISNADCFYNLAGQKVGKDYSGMIIIKGKKVLKR